MPTYHIIISGKVQGVFYRATAKKIAISLKLTGWIGNMPDGNVEAMCSGEKEQLKQFVAWCKHGPEHAEVAHVNWEEKEKNNFTGFSIIH